MELVGYNDLQGRGAYQPEIHKQGNRWIAYIGHHGGSSMNTLTGKLEDNGTSIVDVTDPKNPKYLAHIPGDPRVPGPGETGGAQMARVCDGSTLPRADKKKVYLLRSRGTASHEMWDVTDPAKPALINVVESGLRDTHKSWWECDSGMAFLVSGAPGWRAKRMGQAARLCDVRCRGFRAGNIAVCTQQRSPLAGKPLCDCRAQPATSSRYKRNLALQSHGSAPCARFV
jgi:hypothetical protein